jgi:hypothetical protein
MQKSRQDGELIGTIHLGNSECPVMISTKENGSVRGFYPVNIDDTLKVDNVDGKKIIFTYAPSRAPQPAGCDVDMTITLLTTRWAK